MLIDYQACHAPIRAPHAVQQTWNFMRTHVPIHSNLLGTKELYTGKSIGQPLTSL